MLRSVSFGSTTYTTPMAESTAADHAERMLQMTQRFADYLYEAFLYQLDWLYDPTTAIPPKTRLDIPIGVTCELDYIAMQLASAYSQPSKSFT